MLERPLCSGLSRSLSPPFPLTHPNNHKQYGGQLLGFLGMGTDLLQNAPAWASERAPFVGPGPALPPPAPRSGAAASSHCTVLTRPSEQQAPWVRPHSDSSFPRAEGEPCAAGAALKEVSLFQGGPGKWVLEAESLSLSPALSLPTGAICQLTCSWTWTQTSAAPDLAGASGGAQRTPCVGANAPWSCGHSLHFCIVHGQALGWGGMPQDPGLCRE